jgi:hypothetical protein
MIKIGDLVTITQCIGGRVGEIGLVVETHETSTDCFWIMILHRGIKYAYWQGYLAKLGGQHG